MYNPMRPAHNTHASCRHRHGNRSVLLPLPRRAAVRRNDTQIYVPSQLFPHMTERFAGWAAAWSIVISDPVRWGCHLNQNRKTPAQQTAHSCSIPCTAHEKRDKRRGKLREFPCVCTSALLLNMHFFFQKSRTNSMCQNTAVDCFLGSPINRHKCQSKSNYSYWTATFGHLIHCAQITKLTRLTSE